MSRLQFSKEVFDKLNKSQHDKNTAILLAKFDPNRPVKGKVLPPLTIASDQSNASSKSIKKSRKGLAKESHEIRQNLGIEPKKHKKIKSPPLKETKIRAAQRRYAKKMARIKVDNENLERVRENSKRAGYSSVSNMFSSVDPSRKKPLKKSIRQDISSVNKLNQDLEKLRAIKRDDPNELDRAAMK